MFNVQQITSRLAAMSDAQLAQYARMHKDDPYVLPLAASEFKRRQQLRQSGQMQQGGPKPTIADQEIAMMDQDTLPEDRGIGVLPEQSLAQMADGGIAGYAEGGPISFAGGGNADKNKKSNKFDPDAYMQNPNVQKFLQYLNVYEGSPKANQLVGFKEFEGFEDHPRTPVVFNKKGNTSDAAGMFQIRSKTWDYQRKKLGLTDFSLENQKRAAIGILKDIGALSDIVQGNFDAAKAKATKQWASIPGSTIGLSTGQRPRYKKEAEQILEQPTREAQNAVPVQPKSQKGKTLGERLFNLLPFTDAGAANTSAATAGQKKTQSYSPFVQPDEDFYARLEAAQEAYKKKYGTELPVTSYGRSRYEQQQLFNKKQRGGPGSEKIFTPINPANYPGREVFHTNAVDISQSVSEKFMRKYGLYRPDPKGDPVHYVAIPNWQPEKTNTQVANASKRVEQTTPTTYQPPVTTGIASALPSANATQTQPAVVRDTAPVAFVNETRPNPRVSRNTVVAVAPKVVPNANTNVVNGIASIIPSANAAPVPEAKANLNTNTPITSATDAQNANYIRLMQEHEQRGAAENQKTAAKQKPAERDDAVYDPMTGALIFGGSVYQEGPTTKAPLTSLLTGTADVFLGIPEAVANVVMRNYYNAPVGKHYTFEEAAQAAQDNPIVKAAGYLRSGKWFGVENDPAYRKDPLSLIMSLPSLGVRGIAKKYGMNEEAAQLALDNALLLAPVVKKGMTGQWVVESNLPKKQQPAAPTDASIAQLKTEADAAAKKVEAPRLEAPVPDTSIKVGPDGKAVLPETPTFIPDKTAGIRGLLEDTRTSEVANRRLQQAEAARAGFDKNKPGAFASWLAAHPGLGRAISTAEAITPKITPKRVLSGGTNFSTTPEPDATVLAEPSISEGRPNPAAYFRKITETPVQEAKRVAEEITAPPAPPAPKTTGFSNEDLLTMGLNMMMAQPGQPGGELSQLASNIGRSGITTLQMRREREKLLADQAFRDLYGKYLGKQTEVMGREPEDIRSLRLLEADPALMQTYRQKKIVEDTTAAQTRLIVAFNEAKKLNPDLTWNEFLKDVPEEYLPGGGIGLPQGVTVKPRQ